MTTESKQMEISLDDALALLPTLSSTQLAWLSRRAIDGPKAAAAYVRLACAATADRGVWVDASGTVHLDASGAQVSPGQSAEHVRALAASQGPKALKPIEAAFKSALPRPTRHELLVRTVYATGRALHFGIGETAAAAHAVATDVDSFEGVPFEMAEMMRELQREMRGGD